MGGRRRRGRARSGANRPPDDRPEEPGAPAEPVARDAFGRIERAIAVGVLTASAALLFARLGHYALWDDEAINALHAIGVWRTGDTTAVIGENVVGYRGGAPLVGLRERYTPPLGFYAAAPALGLLGPSAWAARLPFALCGLAAVAVLLLGLRAAGADRTTWILTAEAIVGNVSFFLYCRQCRYYGAAILLTTALGYLYVFRDGRRRSLVAFALLSTLLLAANYLDYAALYACLAADYLLWGRKRRPLAPGDWPWLIIPQVLLGAPIVLTWNPIGKDVVHYQSAHWLAEKATLFGWSRRELDRCEFGIVPLIVLAAWLHARTGRDAFLRLPLAALVYVAAVTAASPQPVGGTWYADVRYLAPMIPLWIAIGVLCLRALAPRPIPAALLGMVVFGTNLFHGMSLYDWGPRSTLASFVGELARPPGDPYSAAAGWINEHVPPGASVWVQPPHTTYPLMFHAPGAIYAWQFEARPDPQLAGLPPIHFRGQEMPNFVVGFGPVATVLAPRLASLDGGRIRYERAAVLGTFWEERYRPELFWRRFRPIPVRDPATEGIHIFRRVAPPIAPRRPLGSP